MGTSVPGTSVPDIQIRPRPISGAIYISDVVFLVDKRGTDWKLFLYGKNFLDQLNHVLKQGLEENIQLCEIYYPGWQVMISMNNYNIVFIYLI